MGRTELLTCLATQNSFGKIRDQAQQVSKGILAKLTHNVRVKNNASVHPVHFLSLLQLTREYNIQCCCLYYPVLKQHIQYEFEACDHDPVERFINLIVIR